MNIPNFNVNQFVSTSISKAEMELAKIADETNLQKDQEQFNSDVVNALKELNKKLDAEKIEREKISEESNQYMVRWNKINLAVAVTAIVVGIAVGGIQIAIGLGFLP